MVLLALPYAPAPAENGTSTLRRWVRLDWIGTALSVAMVTMLVLPLQWGGNEKRWDDPAVIVTFVLVRV